MTAILCTDAETVAMALDLIEARPNRFHQKETLALHGRDDIGAMARESVEQSAAVGAICDGNLAAIGGVGHEDGEGRRRAWILGTEGIETRPRWLLAGVKGYQRRIEDICVHGALWQVVPQGYAAGVGFIRRLGFSYARILVTPNGDAAYMFERRF